MDWKLNFSWLFLLGGGLWGGDLARRGELSSPPVIAALVGAYLAWALYWGLPALWTWLHRSPRLLRPLRKYVGGRGDDGWGFRLGVVLVPLLTGGILFSLFGGGAYQFHKHWSTLRRGD